MRVTARTSPVAAKTAMELGSGAGADNLLDAEKRRLAFKLARLLTELVERAEDLAADRDSALRRRR